MLNLNQLKKLYTNSPLWMKKLYASIPYDIRSGSDYRKWKTFLETEINEDEYQLIKLKETILYAYENTKYYKHTFDNLDISPYDINTLQDFEQLPFIDKDTVRGNYHDMVVNNYPKKKTFFVTTGGTSGQPMKFLQSKNVWAKELAFVMKYFSQYGYSSSMIKASFRGGEFNNLPSNQFWQYNPVHNEIHFSPVHINVKNIKNYVDDLNKYKPYFFHSYPSSLLLLIEQMKNNELNLNYQIKAIFLISENYTLVDIEKIKSFFNCPVSSFYGHSERLIFAPTMKNDLGSYKIDNKYGFFELVDDKSTLISKNKQRGEILGTSFDNFAMPLIRYRTNDYTQYIDHKNNEISMIEGRWIQEYLSAKDGLKVYLTALNMHSDVFKNVLKYQFHQDHTANVTLHVIVNKLFQDIDKVAILDSLQNKAGHAILFELKVVEQLELTSRGKFKNIIKTFD